MRRSLRVLVFKLVVSSFVAGAIAVACLSPTYSELHVTTNVACADVRGVRIVVGRDTLQATQGVVDNDATIPAIEDKCGPDFGTLSLVPRDDAEEGAVIVLLRYGARGTGSVFDCQPPLFKDCIVARRKFRYAAQTKLSLPVSLDLDCLNVPCDALSTCVHGKCKAVDTICSGGVCDIPLDATTVNADATVSTTDAAPDAGAQDGGIDADADAGDTGGPSVDAGPRGVCRDLPGFTCRSADIGSSSTCTSAKPVCVQTSGGSMNGECFSSFDAAAQQLQGSRVVCCTDRLDCDNGYRCLSSTALLTDVDAHLGVDLQICQPADASAAVEFCDLDGGCRGDASCSLGPIKGYRRCQ